MANYPSFNLPEIKTKKSKKKKKKKTPKPSIIPLKPGQLTPEQAKKKAMRKKKMSGKVRR